ncbi:MAG: EAL domain-containing protein [Actinomycetota bacterium]|nr:EAL domain-containing protein [Actinomycetota bacterium]
MAVARARWNVVLVVGLAAVAVYFALPGEAAKNVDYSVIGVASVVCVAVGIARRRPAERLGWVAIATGNLCFVCGDAVYDGYQYVLHRPTPFPSLADALYLAGYPWLVLGIARVTRGSAAHGRTRESVADAAVVAAGALAISWHFLMGAYATDPTVGIFGRLVNLAYPVLDLAVLFIVVEGLVFGTARRPVHRLLAVAMIAMVVSDFVYDVMVVHGTYTVGDPVDAGWLLNYLLVGVAALHPSMALRPGAVPPDAMRVRRRLPLVAVAGLIAPVILVVGALLGSPSDVGPLAAISVAVFVLVVVRLWWMLDHVGGQARALEVALGEREALEGELRVRAFHDDLTGLANRALLHDRVDHALASVARGHGLVGVCFCDLDGFKTINDSLGHLAGDAVLVAAGKRISGVVRPGDTVARLGGDEFAVLMEDLDDPAVAVAVAERVVSVLRQPVGVGDREVGLSVSVGVAVAGISTTTEQLLSQADSAMYAAKAAGRGRLEIFEPTMLDGTLERLEITSALAGALERDELFLEYQPQFRLADGTLEGFEALVRWQHPRLGLVGPLRFVPLAEETGHIVPIGRFVLEKACEQAARWSRAGADLSVSVNLSGRQLTDPHLVDDVRTAVAVSGVDPSRLVLEITESAVIADAGRVGAVLRELKSAGVRLAIDDFGTGYCSLTYLKHFPIDVLKIDKSFVDPLADPGAEGEAFITTMVGLAHSLGMRTVAEGIEHADQRLQLTELGCDSAQGFLMSRPLGSDAASDLVDVTVRDAEPGAARASR